MTGYRQSPLDVNATPPPAPAGWVRVLTEQWMGTTINENIWFLARHGYGSSTGCTAPEHNTVSDGVLKMLMMWRPEAPPRAQCLVEGANWYVGGMRLRKTHAYVQDSQRVTVRWRVVPNGVISHRILPMRWRATAPSNIVGEEDWCEGHNDAGCTTFFHWITPPGGVGTRSFNHPGFDLTQWHVMTAEKDGYRMRFWIDGVLRFDYIGNETETPTIPRILVLQQECIPPGAGGCPAGTTGSETIEVDYVTVENKA
jgi:hypothetical protein